MWLATKYADSRGSKDIPLPDLGTVKKELGDSLEDAIKYRKLYQDHPHVERGSDSISDHYTKLKAAEADRQGARNVDMERRQRAREEGKLRPLGPAEPDTSMTSWVTEPRAPSPTTPAGLPGRIPGWYTGDAMDAPPPGYGTPPMPKRSPGDSMRPSHGPSYAPKPQSIKDWVQWLRGKGISVDHSLQRPDAARPPAPQEAPPPMLRGHDIWGEFTKPGRHRRAASAIVTGFIEGVLFDLGEMLRKTASRLHDTMTGEGWSHHESGSGNWYQKKIGDKVHVIVRQPDGWIHNYGPDENNMGDNHMMFDDIQGALMRANRGNVQVGFRPPPIGQQNFSSNSWSDER